VQGVAAVGSVPVSRRPFRREARIEATHPVHRTVAALSVDDVLDVDVVWEDEDGSEPSWEPCPPAFTFARSPADLMRAYGARPVPGPGRLVDVRA